MGNAFSTGVPNSPRCPGSGARLCNVKALFKEIRAGDLGSVTARLDADPSLVAAVAKAPPKKDDGQSPLQVAIKSGNFEVAHLLLDRGADVNFIDSSEINPWNVPVLHDAVRAAVFSSRFGRNWALPGEPPRIEVLSTAEQFARAFAVLERLVTMGARPDAQDSHGNPALSRAVLDVRQVLEDFVLADLEEDLHRIFDLLIGAGADPEWVDSRTGRRLMEQFASEPVRRFLLG